MNYRIDPRGPHGGADLVMALANSKTGDTITILLPKSLEQRATNLVESVRQQATRAGVAINIQHEIIDK